MAEQSLVQVRVDNQLKKEVTAIYDELGIDLPTAIRMFLKRSKMVRGVPFETRLPENVITRAEAAAAFEQLRMQASDVEEMSLDEINAEIYEARKSIKRSV